MAGLDPAIHDLSSPGSRVWLRQPEPELDGPGDPVITALDRFRDAGEYWMPACAGMTRFQPRSSPPVALVTAATILAATVSISASVSVFSRG
jgi:hypothetical protein